MISRGGEEGPMKQARVCRRAAGVVEADVSWRTGARAAVGGRELSLSNTTAVREQHFLLPCGSWSSF